MEKLPVILVLAVVLLWIGVLAWFVRLAKLKLSKAQGSRHKSGSNVPQGSNVALSPVLLCAMFVSIFAALVTVVVL